MRVELGDMYFGRRAACSNKRYSYYVPTLEVAGVTPECVIFRSRRGSRVCYDPVHAIFSSRNVRR